MSRTRIAVVGRTGRGNYGHDIDTVWLNVPDVDIVAVADEHEQGRAAAVKRLGAKNAYADYRAMLKKERPQIVSVAPRFPDCHRDMVIACAEAGASMLLEKPLCRNLTEADEMVTACERHHVKLAIAHQTRYSPRLQRVRELIAAGMLGDILELRGHGKDDARGGGQDLMVLGTHVMDLMRLLAGEARWCFARVGMAGKERVVPATRADVRAGSEEIGPIAGNHITATYGFDRRAVGYFNTCVDPPSKGARFGLTIFGTRGVIQVTTGTLPAAYFLPDAGWFPGRSRTAWQEISSAGVGKPETLKDGSLRAGNVLIARDLIEAVAKDRQPKGSIYDGRAALEMILAIYESHRLRTTVDLPLKNRRHPLTML